MMTKTNKILSGAVVIAVLLSVIVLAYVNLPKQTGSSSQNNNNHNTTSSIFTLMYGDKQTNFTITDLTQLELYTAKGGYRTRAGVIKGIGNYTGINITTLVSTFHPAPLQYSIIVLSDDGTNLTYNFSTILGNVDIYNPNNASDSTPIGEGGVIMVLVYQYEGNALNESKDGKLKIAFLNEQGSITAAYLWMYKVNSIKIITE
jgi:hypothetical protein